MSVVDVESVREVNAGGIIDDHQGETNRDVSNYFGTKIEPASTQGEYFPTPVIQNVVSTVSLDCHLNLQKVSCYTRNSEYNPRRFCGVIMRIFSPKCTALIFSSGKIVVTGVKHEEEALLASRKYARIMQKIGFKVRFNNFKIHNMVATCDLKFPIRVDNLHKKHVQFSSYEPELFPALIYRMIKPRVVLLIFVNGKVVVTGAKCRDEINEALKNILPILKSFKK